MRTLLFALLTAVTAIPGYSQRFGAAENLAPNIPTPQIVVDRMLELGRVKSSDMVYDLGSGDGRIVIAAAQKFGARAVGVEIMPDLCRKATEKIKSLGLDDKVKMVEDSALRIDLSPANVVTMCLLTTSNDRLRPNLEKMLKPGSRVVSYQFPIRDWKPVETSHVRIGSIEHVIYVYEMGRQR
jgi:ubiquinone/menaquinone biosynthesis C-methylase UbiE